MRRMYLLSVGVLAALCMSASAARPSRMLTQQCSGVAASGGACGTQSGLCCPSGECCSQFGFCGVKADHCGVGCQAGFGSCSGGNPIVSQPTFPQPQPIVQPVPQQPSGSGVGALLSAQQWEEMFPSRNSPGCHGASTQFYSHAAFLSAAATFPAFATSSDMTTNKRELAAFLAHIAHETGGLCWIIEGGAGGPPADTYCQPGQYPCAPGRRYHGRGPIQLSWNYNYYNAGQALGFDGINNPDAVAADPVLAFRTALWFWMTPQSPKPSAHDVMAGRWTPSAADTAAGRTPGFGMVINIINGGLECGKDTPVDKEATRISYYSRMAAALGVTPDPNTSCANMRPF